MKMVGPGGGGGGADGGMGQPDRNKISSMQTNDVLQLGCHIFCT